MDETKMDREELQKLIEETQQVFGQMCTLESRWEILTMKCRKPWTFIDFAQCGCTPMITKEGLCVPTLDVNKEVVSQTLSLEDILLGNGE